MSEKNSSEWAIAFSCCAGEEPRITFKKDMKKAVWVFKDEKVWVPAELETGHAHAQIPEPIIKQGIELAEHGIALGVNNQISVNP